MSTSENTYWNGRKWAKWANAFFKKDKPLGSEPWFNPEAVTEQKREWLEQQSSTVQSVAWPEHIYENFFIVGLPPDMELTQVAEQLCELERKKQRNDSDSDTEHIKEHLQPPKPSFAPQVLYRSPPGAPAPISDEELAALAFPSGVAPEKLRRTPSLSALDELVMGRDSDQQQQCFVFMLKVGGNFPLYGCCWYVREMLHRPPYLARQHYRSCRAPFRQCMIAAPRCYCLLSHYPFFDLHFRVLKIILDLERLERLLEYDSEKSKLRPPGCSLMSPSSPRAMPAAGSSRRSLTDTSAATFTTVTSAPGSLAGSSRSQSPAPAAGGGSGQHGAGGSLLIPVKISSGLSNAGSSQLQGVSSTGSMGSAAGAGAPEGGAGFSRQEARAGTGAGPASALVSRGASPEGDLAVHVVHNRQHYCAECAGIIEDMCPFTPGATPAVCEWQQQRHRLGHLSSNSSLAGLGGSDRITRGSDHQQDRQQPLSQLEQVQQQLLQQQQQAAGLLQHHHHRQLQPLQTDQQQQQQQQGVQTMAVGVPVCCEVCGKRLRASTPEGPLSSTSTGAGIAVAGAAAGDAAAAAGKGNSQGSNSSLEKPHMLLQAPAAGLGTDAGGLQQAGSSEAGGALQPAATAPSIQEHLSDRASGMVAAAKAWAYTVEQQQQGQQGWQEQGQAGVGAAPLPGMQFDAVAAAVAEFDAAAGGSASGAGAASNQAVQGSGLHERWSKWQDVMSALRQVNGNGLQQLQASGGGGGGGGGGSAALTEEQDASSAAIVPETSMVQRMWEAWAPKALEGSGSADAGGSGRLPGGLGFFRRASRASGHLSEQPQQPLPGHSTRTSSPAMMLHPVGSGAGGLEHAGSAPEHGADGFDSHQHRREQQEQQLKQQPDLAPVGPQLGLEQQQGQQHDEQQQMPWEAIQQSELQQQPQQARHAQSHVQQQQQHGSGAYVDHGRSRLGPDMAHTAAAAARPRSPEAADTTGAASETWLADPNLRSLTSYTQSITTGDLAATSPHSLRKLSDASSFYSAQGELLTDAADSQQQQVGPATAADVEQAGPWQQQRQQQEGAGQLQQHRLSTSAPEQQQQRWTSAPLLRRQPSPPARQLQPLPLVQLPGIQQRWSDPANWPSRPRTPSPLPLLGSTRRDGAGSRSTQGGTGSTRSSATRPAGDALVLSAFAAIAAAAEPFDAAGQSQPAAGRDSVKPSTSSSSLGVALLQGTTSGGSLSDVTAATAADSSQQPDWDGSNQAASTATATASVNVTIGGGLIPTTDAKQQQQGQVQVQLLQPPSRSNSGRRSALFEEVALRRSGDMSSELCTTIAHLVTVDSGALLAAYYASPVPQPGKTYRLLLGDLYRLEFERSLPLERYAPPGRSRLRQEVLSYAEVECAQHLQLWTVAALCRSLSLDNIITLLNAALLEKQLVVFCPHIGTLGSVVLSLVPLLRPFMWQSLMMPVTPVNMLGFLEAPVPFVLGVQHKTPDVASRCHGLMRVNVYKNAIKNASMPALPNSRQLAAALAPYHMALCEAAPLAVERPVHVITPDEEEAARGFLAATHDYLSKLCGDLRLHTIVNVGMSKRTGIFMKDSLIDSLPAKDRPFMRAFTETQMFAAYADGVISDYCES